MSSHDDSNKLRPDKKKRYVLILYLTIPFIFIIIIILLWNGADMDADFDKTSSDHDTMKKYTERNPYSHADITVEIIPAPNNTYGYNIRIDGRILIHQPGIPALPGTEGFKTEDDALKVGEFVIEKIHRNIFPPSVTRSELDSLGVL